MACREMALASTAELARLGVPFFDIQEDLIVRRRQVVGQVRDSSSGEKTEGRIGEEELEALQTKMLELLEDLCKE